MRYFENNEKLNEIRGILTGGISYCLDPRIVANTNFENEVKFYFNENDVDLDKFLIEMFSITMEYSTYRRLYVAIGLFRNDMDKCLLNYKLKNTLISKEHKEKVRKI